MEELSAMLERGADRSIADTNRPLTGASEPPILGCA
jgi:hypothetical protein